MAFQDATRRKFMPLSAQTKGTSNPLTWQVPKTGLLAGLYITIRGHVVSTGAIGNANPAGMASIIRRVRLITNAGIDLVSISGVGYTYLQRHFLEDYKDPVPGNTGTSAVTSAAAPGVAFNLDMYIPAVLNSRDPVGLFMLQNEQTLVQLQVEFEADAAVANNVAVDAVVTPYVEIFTVPQRTEDWPRLDVVQQIVEDTQAVTAVGQLDYYWPRGNTYVQVLHGYGIGVSAADNWSRAQLIVNQSDVLNEYSPAAADIEYSKTHGVARPAGLLPFDLLGSSGLGSFGSARDLFYSGLVTDLFTRITVSAQPGTLYTVRRQLIALS